MRAPTLLSLTTLLNFVTALPAPSAAAAAAPSLDEFLSSPMTFEKEKRQSNSTTTSYPNATVQLCTQPSFKGECTNSTWPVNQCIDLRGYAGITESFLPGDGFQCLVMQGKCDATEPFTEIGHEDAKEGGDLTIYDWVDKATSYMCFTEIGALQRFVRLARLRVAGGRA